MKRYFLLLAGLLLASTPVHAASVSLSWDYGAGTVPAQATVQSSATCAGTFATMATVASLPSTYKATQTDGTTQCYRISNQGGVSNTLSVTTPPAGSPSPTVDQRVTTLEGAVIILQQNETADDAAALALTARVSATESKNIAQDQTESALALRLTTAEQKLNLAATATQIDGVSARLTSDEAQVSILQSQQSADTASLTANLSALKARVTALEASNVPPAPTNNLSVTILSPDSIQVDGLACTSLKTTGTGLRRLLTCVH